MKLIDDRSYWDRMSRGMKILVVYIAVCAVLRTTLAYAQMAGFAWAWEIYYWYMKISGIDIGR